MIRQNAGSNLPKINTLLVVPWDEERGGVVSVVENLARHLQARGHTVLFFHPGPALFLKRRLTKLGFPGVQLRATMPFGLGSHHTLLRLLAFPFLFTTSMVQLIWLLRKLRINVVNLHYLNDSYLYFAICKRLLSIRLVSSIHGRDAFYQERPKDKYSLAFKFLIHSSDLIILPSKTYREKLLTAFPGVKDKTIFIHNGINPEQFKPAEYGQTKHRTERYILCVAELREYKGIDVLLHAAKPLLASDRSLTLVLAGDGPLRGELESLAASLEISHQTQFLGTRGAAEIANLMHGCETLVLPSREEPFGIVIIEAMACKTPVVASAVGGIPEIIEPEISGILVEPENPQALTEALRRVLTNHDLRRTLAENGYARVMQRFCFTHTGAAYEGAFASLLRFETLSHHSPSEVSSSGFSTGHFYKSF
jgi:glycosyltransferase involved in cell wall biosynthesis